MLSKNGLPLSIGDCVIFADIQFGEPVLEVGIVDTFEGIFVGIDSEEVGFVRKVSSQVYKSALFEVV